MTKNSKGFKASGELTAGAKIPGGTPFKKGSEMKAAAKIPGGTPCKGCKTAKKGK